MKLMSKLLLINWHYFSCELIEFGQLNFLTGKNAHGKSTIIDAMQVVLLGDTSGSFFNKAASGKGGRSLKGYLLGELRDDEGGGFCSLRGDDRFTSYIAIEFFDTEKKKNFTVGCCFDVYSENDYHNITWFIYDATFPRNNFINGNIPMTSGELRVFLKEEQKGHYETVGSNREFRDKLCGRLGGLRVERFVNLLKKAVSFNPDVKIQSFISEFVCDEQQTIDVAPMQETIRSYKQLESEADILSQKITLLEKIVNAHGKYKTAVEKEREYSFLIDRANAESKAVELLKQGANSTALAEKLEILRGKITSEKSKLEKLGGERDTLNAQLLNNESLLQLKELERQIAETEARITRIQNDFDSSLNIASAIISGWNKRITEMIKKVGESDNVPNKALAIRIEDLFAGATALNNELQNILVLDADRVISIGAEGFSKINGTVDSLRTSGGILYDRISDEQKSLAEQKSELQREYEKLEQGINPFPQDVIDLKEAIISRLRLKAGVDVKVNIVAEVSEIENDRWRNVIEGYLNTQKYYIVVAAEHFKEALSVYDKIKTSNKIYGTGVVDIEKLKKRNPSRGPKSLATEIKTTDNDVRIFLDYVLGNVIKCDDVQELRGLHTAVTDEGMLYKGFVARAMNPKTWEKPAIGQGAIKRRLLSVKSEISSLVNNIAIYSGLKIAVSGTNELDISRITEFERTIEFASETKFIPKLSADATSLRRNRDAINTSTIDKLTERIRELEASTKELSDLLTAMEREDATNNEKLRVIKEETIPKLQDELSGLQFALTEKYNDEWMEATGNLRYERELSQRKTPENISSAFSRERSKQENLKNDLWNELCDSRRKYNTTYKMGLPEKAIDNGEFDMLWLELSENSLPSYTSRIADAKDKAIEQFRYNFLDRLKDNIRNAEQQVKDLNNALKGSSFGDDSYRFKIIPNKTNERFYNAIMDDMLLQGWNLMSVQFEDKYKEELADLFSLITNEDGTGGKIGDYERRVTEYTDYRTYLDFDLEVTHKDGTSERLSKTLNKKSGGETQTPFYIAVLASFAQLYRIGRDKSEKSARLIIFDEAFSKMDGERIARSIELLRKFGFQVVLSAPSDKIADIATLVDRNLLVYREGKSTCVRTFDPRQIEEIVYD